VCEFTTVEREVSAWPIQALCTDATSTHRANVRLLRAGNWLIWSSEGVSEDISNAPYLKLGKLQPNQIIFADLSFHQIETLFIS
jgi:hypothetical protein